MKELHMICNAHLDPVWLWDWEEGIAAALSTFRIAARFCQEYDGFIFNHNEALLYQWVEEYEPDLFQTIQDLVKEGKWHIMGGWFLQPDCNMPSGESFVRQMEAGREYFYEKFGVLPKTAVNFDPFGHSRGMVQIMHKAGYDSYIFCRPSQEDCQLADDDFLWIGFDGSSIKGHRSSEHYNSLMGEAGKKITEFLKSHREQETGLLLWGIGNHGGGPSHVDMAQIQNKRKENPRCELRHSIPESYFEQIENEHKNLPEYDRDLNPWAVGCYTAQIRIKQTHRKLEGLLYMTEKMVSAAVFQKKMKYPEEELKEAERALLTAEFHDILPGSAVKSVEESGIRIMNYGMELLEKQKNRAFFALAQGELPAKEGEYPILIYNPHPYPVKGVVTCEFQMQNQNWDSSFGMPKICYRDTVIPCQVEKEACNMNLDWRKKVAFYAELEPMQMNRYDCTIRFMEKQPEVERQEQNTEISFTGEHIEAVISKKTGLMDSLRIDGIEYLKKGAFGLSVRDSGFDPWAMNVQSFPKEEGRFLLMEKEEGAVFSGVDAQLESVRIIENGQVRTIVEALFRYHNSRAVIHYILPQKGKDVDLEISVEWMEKGKMLKLEIPTCLNGENLCETAYGVQIYEASEKERVFQRWCGVFDKEKDGALTCINNGCYGGDFRDGTMRISLIHSAAYSAHPIEERTLLDQDRSIPCMDQGERNFCFRLGGGSFKQRMENVASEAAIFQEKPLAVAFFPTEKASVKKKWIEISDPGCILGAMKKIRGRDTYLMRLFESTGMAREVTVSLWGEAKKRVWLNPYEIKTLELDPETCRMAECPMIPSVIPKIKK